MPSASLLRRLSVCAAILLLTSPRAARADILHLNDGTRHYGTVEAETDSEIVFRVRLGRGESSMVRRFARSSVQRLERTSIDTPPDVSDDATTAQKNDAGRWSDRQAEQVLREAFELLDDRDDDAAVRVMQKLVLDAGAERLKALDELCRATRGAALDELLASTRLRGAMNGREGKLFDLRYVTPFESAAMGALLEKLLNDNAAATFHGRSVESWAADPAAYDTLQPDAPAMVRAARLATAAASARLRFDARLKKDSAERARLIVLRDELTRLSAHVRGMVGFTQLGVRDDESDPTLQETRRIAASQPASAPASLPLLPTDRKDSP